MLHGRRNRCPQPPVCLTSRSFPDGGITFRDGPAVERHHPLILLETASIDLGALARSAADRVSVAPEIDGRRGPSSSPPRNPVSREPL
jgi:hypothetical protein